MSDRHPSLDRRTAILTSASAFLMPLVSGAFPTRANSAPSARAPVFDDLSAYCGVYRSSSGATGVDRFINDNGDGILLWTDHQSGAVRQMFFDAPDVFAVGEAFAAPDPVEQVFRFDRDESGRIVGLVARTSDGAETSAVKSGSVDEAVSFRQGDATLSGTLILPEGEGPHPAIVLLHGSGPLTRYSFGPYPRFFNAIGLAVLVFDKRGTGASTGWRIDASTGAPDRLAPSFYPDDLTADAIAALELLRTRSAIDPERIGCWGSSEGGMLSTQVAARAPGLAFAINSSGFMGPLWRTTLYQTEISLRAAGAPEDEIAQALAFNQFALDVARTGSGYAEYLERREHVRQSGKTNWFTWYLGVWSSLEQMRWAWDHILAFDPLPALANVKCPTLGVFGEFDLLTDSAAASAAMAEALSASGNEKAIVRVFQRAGHSLMETPSLEGPQGNRMAPGLFDQLHEFIG